MAKLCHRAREWTSLSLDGELSEFERALLRAHLDRCSDCREFDRAARAATEHVRSTPLLPLSRAVALPARRRPVLTPRRLGAAAAAAVCVVGLTSVVTSLESERSPARFPAVQAPDPGLSIDRELRAIRRRSLTQRATPTISNVHSLQRRLRTE